MKVLSSPLSSVYIIPLFLHSDWVPLNVYIVWSIKSVGIDISSKLSIFSSPGLAGGVAERLFLAFPVLCHSGGHHDHLETVC